MRAFLKWGALATLLAVLGLMAWFFYVPAYDASAVVALRQATMQRLQRREQVPFRDNGFLDFVSWIPPQEDVPDTPEKVDAAKLVREIRAGHGPRLVPEAFPTDDHATLSPWYDVVMGLEPHDEVDGNGDKVDDPNVTDAIQRYHQTQANMKTHPERMRTALQRFEHVLPQIRLALAKPAFAWPSPLGPASQVKGYTRRRGIEITAVAQSLLVHGALSASQGRALAAANDDLAVLRLGSQLAGNGALRKGQAMQNVALYRLRRLMARRLPEPVYRHIGTVMDALPSIAAQALDDYDEFDRRYGLAMAIQQFRDSLHLPLLGVIWKRDMRLHDWLYWRYRPCLVAMKRPQELGLDTLEDGKFLLYHLAFLAMFPFPQEDPDRLVINAGNLANTMGAVRLVVALEAWHAAHGAWPNRVQELVPAYVSRLPVDHWTPNGQWTYGLERGHPVFKMSFIDREDTLPRRVQYLPPVFSTDDPQGGLELPYKP